MIVGIVGSGAMGSGIAQVAALAGEEVRLFDISHDVRNQAMLMLQNNVNKLVGKGIISPPEGVSALGRIYICEHMVTLADCDLIIEAIIEDLDIKKDLFSNLEKVVSPNCILATNTSSLSIASIAATLIHPERCLGIHFFNPPFLMRLVEVIPAIRTNQDITIKIRNLIESWGKAVVIARDTPGFIVNKVARPFYSEAIRIMEEGIADIYTIDQAMTTHGLS